MGFAWGSLETHGSRGHAATSGGFRISPRCGANSPGGQHMILPKIPKNCMKLKEFGRGGHVSKILLCTSADDNVHNISIIK